jgi:hypothetical protein
MNLRPFVIALSLSAAALCSTASKPAPACGPVRAEDVVEVVVGNHFEALDMRDRERMLSAWNEGAAVVSIGQPTLVETVEQASTRWITHKQPVTYKILKVEVADRTAKARVEVSFEGNKIEDSLLLVATRDDRWRIAGKSSRVLEAAARSGAASRY